jgi:hypothetical protein
MLSAAPKAVEQASPGLADLDEQPPSHPGQPARLNAGGQRHSHAPATMPMTRARLLAKRDQTARALSLRPPGSPTHQITPADRH